jgi:two-component system nitrate/nitrite sensor histidine kinase NarX
MMNDISGTNQAPGETISLLAAPLLVAEGKSIGAVLVGNDQQLAFTRRQLDLLKTLAGHMALQVNNAALITELEFKTMLEERTRLAREIHDGLAQTLGFLKLQVAQLQNYLQRAEYERLEKGLHTSYATLSDAYLEVRDAIDGLRTAPADENAVLWIKDLLEDFEAASGIQTEMIGCDHLQLLPAEIQVQLIRIVQEAMSNVRKHAHATRVSVTCRRAEDELLLEITDNGRGFSPGEVTAATQYGLRGMRERAELIGAEFQVISIRGQGTTIQLAVYMPKKEKA